MSVVGCTVTMHGVVIEVPVAAQVFASLIPEMVNDALVVRARKSARPLGAGEVVSSTIRNCRRVTGAPVLLVMRRVSANVPNVDALAGSLVKLRNRLGGAAADTKASRSTKGIAPSRRIGEARFSGPGAPRRCPAPVKEPFVSTNRKSTAFSPVSLGLPGVAHPTPAWNEHSDR